MNEKRIRVLGAILAYEDGRRIYDRLGISIKEVEKDALRRKLERTYLCKRAHLVYLEHNDEDNG